ncbi:response regulator [Spartinivicinus poritis]|uniref:histidine kinase n=1 Tax=Spartinivicinus poritis TaxID=2994640 RepID=A0ABT5U240_9GAMM|nr:response regulator [Spartinivicinus sp. A2-2]MDE1460434.1 response regulator [Spartinivicinus sp. A2-2]
MLKQQGIKSRVLALALIPTISISLILGTFFTLARINDLDALLLERSQTTIQQLIPITEHTLSLDNLSLIQEIASSALEKNDVRSVSLFSHTKVALAHAGPKIQFKDSQESYFLTRPFHTLNKQSLLISTPIYAKPTLSPVNTETSLSSGGEKVLLGWLMAEFSRSNTEIKKYQTILASGLLILSGVLINLFLALKMGHNITGPLMKIISAVNHMREGNLDTRINTNTGGELRALETGINAMVASLQRGQLEMQQNIEQSTKDLQETLETIEIQNIELDMARKEALEASRIKSEFLANMSHEIRTPLNGIIGFTNLLLRSKLNERQFEYLSTIQKSSEGLLSIINDVLDFSKIEAGKLELESIPINLRESVEEVLTILAPSAHDKSLELIPLIYSDTPIHLMGDPLRLKQILTNLVSNAIKFTNDGSIVVRAMLEDEKDNLVTIKISVTDTGIGLSNKQQKELFKAFSQADTSTTRNIGGTGLGLVISKRLAQQMSGEVGVESELGKGSTFWFTLTVPKANEPTLKEHFPAFSNTHVLIMEHHDLARQAIVHLLSEYDLNVDSCANESCLEEKPQEAKTQGKTYDVLVVSHHPAYLDLEKIRSLIKAANENKQYLVILAHTNKEEAINNILDQHNNALCIVKPLCHNRLYRALSYLLLEKSKLPQGNQSNIARRINQAITRQPHILAVDDNPANLRLVTALLEDLGAKVTAVDSGTKAIIKTKQYHFDLIFMDVQMPHMDGLETTRRIRERELSERRIPIIALTAHALAEEKKQLLLAGMDDYMTKPINENQLQHIIKKWTGLHVAPIKGTDYLNDTSHAEPETKVVDLTEGIKLAGGKEDLANDMLSMLFENLKNEQEQIRALYRNKQWPRLLEVVHKLHGATRYCGVPLLRNACNNMETILKASEKNKEERRKVAGAMEELIEQIEQLLDWQRRHEGTE